MLEYTFDTFRHVAKRLLAEPSGKFKAQLKALGFSVDALNGHSWRDTDFRDEDLTGLDFSGCDLTGSNFAGSDVAGCFFSGAKVGKDFLSQAINVDKAYLALRKSTVEKGHQPSQPPTFYPNSIMVMGVGGAGGNAVDNFIERQIGEVRARDSIRFSVANTDDQALRRSKAHQRILLGRTSLAGLGAGARPEVGETAAEESRVEIEAALEGVEFLFIAAGMGGGSGSGASPVIAKIARQRGITVVGAVTLPFGFEGSHRMEVAQTALKKLRGEVDAIIVVPNQNLFRVASERTTFAEAFRMADASLEVCVTTLVKALTSDNALRLTPNDVSSFFSEGAMLFVGRGQAEGPSRHISALEQALDNPLFDTDPLELKHQPALLHVQSARPFPMIELDRVMVAVFDLLPGFRDVAIATSTEPSLEDKVCVEFIALQSNR